MKRSLLLIVVLAIACAPQRRNPLSNSFHDITAHYNAYFLAKQRIKEIEKSIFDGYAWNYDKIIPIYPQFDSAKAASLSDQIKDCIQKSSIAIQRHPGSKWEDDSYILVGLARHYAREFPDAIETFKYVNKHSKDDGERHQALAELIRTFTEIDEFNNAVAVTDYLAKEKLNQANKKLYHLNTAYLYQKKGDLDKMLRNLVLVDDLIGKSKDKARINFIIGQTYHSLDFESEAFRYYRNVLKNDPKYELEFYTKLYMAQVTELTNTSDLKRVRRYFKGLLGDSKNKEYQDKIYFELAGFELKNGNIDEAIANYKLSIKTSTNNQRQKAYSYLSLGQINYDSLTNFIVAKSYYDSTVLTMPKDEENYADIKNRQEILVDFVEQITIIRKNDSLLHLSELPKDSILAMTVRLVRNKREIAKEKKKIDRQASQIRTSNIIQNSPENLISTTTSKSVWYFNNPNAQSKGRNEFLRKWGDRVHEDNWRRKNKSSVTNNQIAPATESPVANETIETPELNVEEEAQALMRQIPSKEEDIMRLLNEIELACYNLGNIYNLRLDKDTNAAESFEALLVRFPTTEYEPEVLYQLFLIYKELNPDKSLRKGAILKSKFPETVYAKLVHNPNYREESFAISGQLQSVYKKLYEKHANGEYHELIFSIDSALSIHPENEFSDNLLLLKILSLGKRDGNATFQFELGNFVKTYPNSELIPYANILLTASEEFQQNRYNSAKARFMEDFKQKHFFVIVYDIEEELTSKIPKLVDGFLEKNNFITLQTGNLILNQTKSMVLVNDFPGRGTSVEFANMFNAQVLLEEQVKGSKIDVFVITEDNFDIFYKTKDISAYLNFFEKHYQ